jgi:hypothetical protein
MWLVTDMGSGMVYRLQVWICRASLHVDNLSIAIYGWRPLNFTIHLSYLA